MNDRRGDAPPANGGEFLLQLLRQSSNSASPAPSPQRPSLQTLSQDPAVAAVGPTIPTHPLPLPHTVLPPNAQDFHYGQFHHSPPSPFALNNYFQQNPNGNPNLNPDFSAPPALFGYTSHQFNPPSNRITLGDDMRKFGSYGDNSKPSVAHQPERGLIFGSLSSGFLQNDARDVFHRSLYRENKLGSSHPEKGLGVDRRVNGLPENSIDIYGNAIGSSGMLRVNEQERSSKSNNRCKHVDNGSHRAVAPPPGFSRKILNVRNRELGYGSSTSDRDLGEVKLNSGDLCKNDRPVNQLEPPGPPNRSSLHSASPSDIEKSMMKYHGEDGEDGKEFRHGGRDDINKDHQRPEIDDLAEQFVGSLGLKSESGEQSDISDKKKQHRDKDYRSDKRGLSTLGQRRRNLRRLTACRSDINSLDTPFLAVFKSLIPADEEKIKQKQLLTVLEKLVAKEWPDAQLYLYGSCANSFGFSKSDIDVCLAMEPANVDKSDVLLKLADILQSDNLQNVQALTRARVPIVKLMDPVTGISCDICVNNMLAVVNTKLLRDYAQIDVRLQQLAFIVKHWAKSRAVNETYQGTLSSYAYVLMCIHFLQQRRPAILPCLQGMETTYFATVDNVDCGFFDQVEKLHNFGSQNEENIAQLVWAFFHYWAYIHDYAKDVISVRTGGTLSKQSKDWTRRIGNDRHLVCIEDPFETSHDLGRVVDKYSIRVLREEFERAAEIMQYDRNPCVTLFEPYIPK